MKSLETVEVRQTTILKINLRISALINALVNANESDKLHLLDMISELRKQFDYLMKNKEWLYNFQSGGWNSEIAADKETAIKQASKRWKDSDNLDVDPDSFRIKTDGEYKNLLSLFN